LYHLLETINVFPYLFKKLLAAILRKVVRQIVLQFSLILILNFTLIHYNMEEA